MLCNCIKSPRGDFAHPSTGDTRAQMAFLEAIENLAPHVIEELHRDVLPSWEEGPAASPTDLLRWEPYLRWSQKHRLPWAWIASVVYKTLHTWARLDRFPCDYPRNKWHVLPSGGEHAEMFVHRFTAAIHSHFDVSGKRGETFDNIVGWIPDCETRANAEKRLKKQFAKLLRAHHDQMEELAASIGMVRLPKKYQVQQHAEWAVRHLVLGESLRKISGKDEHGDRRKTVTEGVRSMEGLLSEGAEMPWGISLNINPPLLGDLPR